MAVAKTPPPPPTVTKSQRVFIGCSGYTEQEIQDMAVAEGCCMYYMNVHPDLVADKGWSPPCVYIETWEELA